MKKILAIYTAFYPENAIGSIRNTKFVKYLVRAGYDITVISPKMSSRNLDKNLYSVELNQISHITVPYSRFFNNYFLEKRNEMMDKKTQTKLHSNPKNTFLEKIKKIIYQFVQEIYTIIRNTDWKNQVKKYISIHEELNGFDLVITSYPSLSSHLLGEHIKDKRIASRWIADFRDLIAYEELHSNLVYKINIRHQTRICKKADVITSVTSDVLRKISETEKNKNNFYYLPNGFDQEDLNDLINSKIELINNYENYFKITYVGSLYGGKRDLSVVFNFLQEMESNNEIQGDKIKFFYAGKDFSIVEHQAKKYNMEKVLINLGFISRSESIYVQNSSNLIIVSTWNTEQDQGLVTGKIYECFLLKKPTLVIVNGTKPGSELGKMIKESKIGFTYETIAKTSELDIQLKNYIRELYNNSLNGELNQKDINEDYLCQFNYQKITEKLIGLIEEI